MSQSSKEIIKANQPLPWTFPFTLQELEGVSPTGDILATPSYITIQLPSIGGECGSEASTHSQVDDYQIVEGTSRHNFRFRAKVIGPYESVEQVGDAYETIIANRQRAYSRKCSQQGGCNCIRHRKPIQVK